MEPLSSEVIQTIEMVQCCAVRFISNTMTLCVAVIISQLQFESLREKRSKACIIPVYKIINRLVCI